MASRVMLWGKLGEEIEGAGEAGAGRGGGGDVAISTLEQAGLEEFAPFHSTQKGFVKCALLWGL